MSATCSVVVLAAGQGTRMRSQLAKVLHPLCGRSLLGHALEAAKQIEPKHIITVVRHERDAVAAEAKRCVPRGLIADQDAIPGTGRAVQCALDAAAKAGFDLGETIVVTSGDVPLLEGETLVELVRQHERSGAAVTAVTTISSNPDGYGRIIRGRDSDSIERIVEHKDASPVELAVNEINAGIYAFNAEFLGDALARLDRNNVQGEVYLTDTIRLAVSNGLKAVPFILSDHWQAEGCNDLQQLAQLRRVLNLRTCRRHMLAGVRIMVPESTYIDVQVTMEPDSIIHAGTSLLGETRVSKNAEIGPFTTLRNVIVSSNAKVPHSVVSDDKVDADEQLQAFTIRSGNSPAIP